MTSITLPLKKFPGKIQQLTIFGGRLIVTPLILLITGVFTLYLHHYLNSASFLSDNFFGLLPYFWGSILILYQMKKSSDMKEKLFVGNLSEIRIIFQKGKNHFRNILKLFIIISFFNILIPTYFFVLYGKLELFIMSMSSITSILLTIVSILLALFSARRIITFISFVSVYEVIFLLTVFLGLWIFNLVLLVASFLLFFVLLSRLDGYNLRKFLHKMIKM